MNQSDHSYFQERLSAFADGELEPSVRAQVEEHLRACAECRSRLQEIEKLGEFVTRTSELADSDYWEKAAQRIDRAVAASPTTVIDLERERGRRLPSPWWWRAPAIAASIVFLGYITLHESDILRDEVLTPVEPTEIQQAHEEPIPEGGADLQETGSDTKSQDVQPAVIPSTSEKPKEDSRKDHIAESPARPDVEKQEGADQQAPVPTTPKTTELGKSIVTLSDRYRAGSGVKPVETLQEQRGTAPEKAILAEKPAADEEEQNYRERADEQAGSMPADTPVESRVILADRQVMEKDLSALQGEELAFWRARRDSLVSQFAEIARQDSSPIGQALRYSLTPARPAARSALSSDDPRQTMKNRTEAALLDAWYRVCRLSSDSSEVKDGLSFIERIAADQKSSNREAAADYLKQLGRQ